MRLPRRFASRNDSGGEITTTAQIYISVAFEKPMKGVKIIERRITVTKKRRFAYRI